MTGGVSRQFHRTVVAFEDEVSTESGSDRVIVLAISIIAIGFYPVATALGTDSMTSAGFLPQIRPLPYLIFGSPSPFIMSSMNLSNAIFHSPSSFTNGSVSHLLV